MKNGPTSKPAQSKPGHEREKQWAYISDTIVRLTTLEVLHAQAYIRMYERVIMRFQKQIFALRRVEFCLGIGVGVRRKAYDEE